jgi:hypothetical protein
MGTKTSQGSKRMNIQLNGDWARFKAHLVRTVGHAEAGNWLRHAAAVMDMESKRKAATIDHDTQRVAAR